MPVPPLCTLDQVKNFLSVSDNLSDSVITSLIPAVSQQLLNEMNRLDLMPETDYLDWMSGGREKLYLKHYPVVDVYSVTQFDGTVIPRFNDSIPTESGWRFVTDPNPENQQYVELVGLVYGQTVCYCWPSKLIVNYRAGYAEVPPAINQAAIEWIAFKRSQAQVQSVNPIVGQVQIGDYSEGSSGASNAQVADYMGKEIPDSVCAVIDQYKRWVV